MYSNNFSDIKATSKSQIKTKYKSRAKTETNFNNKSIIKTKVSPNDYERTIYFKTKVKIPSVAHCKIEL